MNKKVEIPVWKRIIELWESGENLKRIKLINPKDFDLEKSVKNLGLSAGEMAQLGICDRAEVIERNALLHLLYDNPLFREKISSLTINRSQLSIPEDENDFLFFYKDQEENPYWSEVKNLIKQLKQIKLNCGSGFSKKTDQFLTMLEKSLSLEKDEKSFSEEVSRRLKNVAVMEGVFYVNFVVTSSGKPEAVSFVDGCDFSHIHGYKLYNSSYSVHYEAKLPKWLRNGWFYKITGIRKTIQKIADRLKEKKAKNSSLIQHFSDNLRSDLFNGAKAIVGKLNLPSKFVNLKFTFYFNYSDLGLRIKPVSLEMKRNASFNWSLASALPNLSEQQVKVLQTKAHKIKDQLESSLVMSSSAPLYAQIPHNFFDKFYLVPSKDTNIDYRWFAIGHIYNLKELRETYFRLIEERRNLSDFVNQLWKINILLERFEKKAQELGVNLCVPTISAEEHSGVSFKELAPISLIGQTGIKLIPVTLDKINGQMVGLTGRHGGGKTVTGKAILDSIYFALSGLPVFAKSFQTDIKTVLGAVTNDEGPGSTATVFVAKVKTLMEEISKVPVDESLIFIDEIGKGTQQSSGLELGIAILTALSKGGNSVLFNTQILELAEYAVSNLGAVCYKFNKEHQITSGIGSGDIESLIKEMGLDIYLK